MMFRHLQDKGHKGILLIGGATAMVGDPSGRSDMRSMLSQEQVNHNLEGVKSLAKRFIKTDGDNPAMIVNNADWINKFSYVEFLRYVGEHFNVAKMLAADAYVKRLETGGLTFMEMGYMLMQAYDFVHLNREHNCILQIGGSDQWGNIVAGTELSRKFNVHNEGKTAAERPETYGVTCPLLMTRDGRKMGKTASGTLWVARDKTTPYSFYQYFYNTDDADTEMLLKLFTYIPSPEIEDLCKNDIVAAKKTMAYEVTKLVHGENEAEKAVEASKALFGVGNNLEDVPSTDYDMQKLESGVNVVDFASDVGLFKSKGEARRMIQQGGLYIDGQKIEDPEMLVKAQNKQHTMLQKGKKTFLKVVLKKNSTFQQAVNIALSNRENGR
jgi:tyrosyl-tRNA synthetase